MTKSKTQRIIAILLAVAAVALIVLGFIYMPQRNAQSGRDILDASASAPCSTPLARAWWKAT